MSILFLLVYHSDSPSTETERERTGVHVCGMHRVLEALAAAAAAVTSALSAAAVRSARRDEARGGRLHGRQERWSAAATATAA